MNAAEPVLQFESADVRLSGRATGRPHVTIRSLTKRFGGAVIYDSFDLDIPRGELISVFGPNGCGKSTLINMIAGLIPPDAGEILFDGMRLADIKFGYVFQNYREALFPWLRAFDNIAYPLKLMKIAPPERKMRTEQLVARLGTDVVAVAESAIRGVDDARRMADAGFDAVLVGEALVRADDPSDLVRRIASIPVSGRS